MTQEVLDSRDKSNRVPGDGMSMLFFLPVIVMALFGLGFGGSLILLSLFSVPH